MPTAVFVAPFLLEATVRFIQAAAALPGARVALLSPPSRAWGDCSASSVSG
ncbi:MAG: hypothetical protein ACRENL_02570 [Candidatus Dormibacteria bacterium]